MANWKEIHSDFTPELQKEWEDRGFSYEECKDWINIGLKIDDANFCTWLINIKRFDVEQMLNHGNEGLLRREYEKVYKDKDDDNNLQQKKLFDEYKSASSRIWIVEDASKASKNLIEVRENTIQEIKKFKEKLSSNSFNHKVSNTVGNAVSIVGTGLTFTPLAPIGIGLAVGGTVVSVGTTVSKYKSEKNYNKELEELFIRDKKSEEDFAEKLEILNNDLDMIQKDIARKQSENDLKNSNSDSKAMKIGNVLTASMGVAGRATIKIMEETAPKIPTYSNIIYKWFGINKQLISNFPNSLVVGGKVLGAAGGALNIVDIIYTWKNNPKSLSEANDFIKLLEDRLESWKQLNEVLESLVGDLQKQSLLEDKGIKNLLIVGRTGNGKSTISNIVSDTDNFSESDDSISVTKESQSEIFKWKEINYRVIDTVGFSDTKKPKDIFIHEIAKSIDHMPEGINQILFVIGNRYTKEENEAFEMLKNDIFEESIKDYITVVKPRFPNFNKDKKCKEDIQKSLKDGGKLAELIHSCQERFIHVDNPSLDIEDEVEKKIYERKRQNSREKLLNHLKSNCQNIYKVKTWEKIKKVLKKYNEELIQTHQEIPPKQ